MGQLGRHGWSAWRPLLLQRRLMSASSEGGGLATCEMIETGSGLVGKVSFNSPGRLNALTVPMAEDFTHTLTKQLMERYASTKASLGFTFTKIGLHPGMGGTHFLPQLIGPSKSADLLLSGRVIDSKEALQIGLVDKDSMRREAE